MGEGDRYTDNRKSRGRGKHAGKMGGPPGTGDEDLVSAIHGLPRVLKRVIRGPVRRQDAHLGRHLELAQNLDRPVHDLGVRGAAHHDAYRQFSSFKICLLNIWIERSWSSVTPV